MALRGGLPVKIISSSAPLPVLPLFPRPLPSFAKGASFGPPTNFALLSELFVLPTPYAGLKRPIREPSNDCDLSHHHNQSLMDFEAGLTAFLTFLTGRLSQRPVLVLHGLFSLRRSAIRIPSPRTTRYINPIRFSE